jgi:hypothetical protein
MNWDNDRHAYAAPLRSPMTLTLPPGMSGLFGYGSLLLRSSMERTLGRAYHDAPIVATVRGWRRTWDSIYPNQQFYFEPAAGERCYPAHIIYLNIRRDPGAMLNGLIYVVDPGDLARFDAREAVYDRVRIDGDLIEPSVTGGAVYAYVGKPEYLLDGPVPPSQAAVRASYVAIVDEGLRDLGPAFREQYERSTDQPPAGSIVNDQRDG